MGDSPELSIVVPMYNEAENVETTVERLKGALQPLDSTYEIILVDDGSTDGTEAVARSLAERDPALRVVSYATNQGRGKAMRTGFAHAAGDFVCTTEADLAYGEDIIIRMVAELREHPDIDVVVASPYMPGGGLSGVPWRRALVSRLGNRVLAAAMPGNLHTMTGMTRAYRRSAIAALDLESEGKEIHVEIISKALALGLLVREIPATLTWRTRGKSKFKLKRTASTHLVLTFFERPMLLFGAVGLAMLVAGTILGADVAYLRFTGQLTAGRPLITLVVLLVLGGIQVISFGLIGTQIAALRRENVRIQSQNRELMARLNSALREAGEGDAA